jgi:hypothetical protein
MKHGNPEPFRELVFAKQYYWIRRAAVMPSAKCSVCEIVIPSSTKVHISNNDGDFLVCEECWAKNEVTINEKEPGSGGTP